MSFIELGKRISINAPSKRTLDPNEKKVYELLKEGKTPLEAARILHIRMGGAYEINSNAWDVPVLSIYNIITSIREKGWEIPTKEDVMSKLTEENKREIITLRNSGMKVTDIAAKFGVSKTSIHNIISAFAKNGESSFTEDTAETESEPAAAATVTDSEENASENISENIIPETGENVKSPEEIAEINMNAAVAEAVTIELVAIGNRNNERQRRVLELTEELKDLERYIDEDIEKRDALRRYLKKIGYGDVLIAVDGGDSE